MSVVYIVVPLLTFLIICILAVLTLLLHIDDSEVVANKRKQYLYSHLDHLSFFYDAVGRFGRNGDIYCDEKFTVIISLNDSRIGIIGFSIGKQSLSITQMQGIRGINMKGVDLPSYLIRCAEKIAVALNKSIVKIQPAENNAYYDSDKFATMSDLHQHQLRLEKMYNLTPMKMGYGVVIGVFGKIWFVKTITQ